MIREPRTILVILPVLLGLGVPAQRALAVDLTRQQQIELFNEALRAFNRGTEHRQQDPLQAQADFRESAEKLQLLVDSGIVNGKLYYNLGNAYQRSRQLGKAIANYRRAERLIPSDGQLEANMRFARQLRRNHIATGGQQALWHTLFAWHFRTSWHTRMTIGLIAYVLFWLLLCARHYAPALRWGIAWVPCLILWLTLGTSLFYEQVVEARRLEGVIVTDEVIVRKGNGHGFEPQFEQPLYPGDEFTVVERRRDWMHIVLLDGNSGWIPVNSAELI